MGVIIVNCPACQDPHPWFTGNLDQRCSACMEVDKFMDDNKELMDDLAKMEEVEKAMQTKQESSEELIHSEEHEGIAVFIDGVDWDHEIGEASDGNKVYPSVEDLKANNECWESCGIVKCRLVFEEWVAPQDFSKKFTKSISEVQANHDAILLKVLEKYKTVTEERIKVLAERMRLEREYK